MKIRPKIKHPSALLIACLLALAAKTSNANEFCTKNYGFCLNSPHVGELVPIDSGQENNYFLRSSRDDQLSVAMLILEDPDLKIDKTSEIANSNRTLIGEDFRVVDHNPKEGTLLLVGTHENTLISRAKVFIRDGFAATIAVVYKPSNSMKDEDTFATLENLLDSAYLVGDIASRREKQHTEAKGSVTPWEIVKHYDDFTGRLKSCEAKSPSFKIISPYSAISSCCKKSTYQARLHLRLDGFGRKGLIPMIEIPDDIDWRPSSYFRNDQGYFISQVRSLEKGIRISDQIYRISLTPGWYGGIKVYDENDRPRGKQQHGFENINRNAASFMHASLNFLKETSEEQKEVFFYYRALPGKELIEQELGSSAIEVRLPLSGLPGAIKTLDNCK